MYSICDTYVEDGNIYICCLKNLTHLKSYLQLAAEILPLIHPEKLWLLVGSNRDCLQ
jgi:hypothetical protein